MSARIDWGGTQRNIQNGLEAHKRKVYDAIRSVATYFAPIVEAEAKANAVWTDRTGLARKGLEGLVEDISESVVAIVLQGGVDYQVFLELKHQGRYAIIMPTLEANYPAVMNRLREVFG